VTDLQANRALALKFGEAWNSRNMALFDEIFHPEMIWHIAITPPGREQLVPLQSETLSKIGVTWQKAIYSKQETLDIFNYTFAAFELFNINLSSVTAEEDRVVIESQGNAVHPGNGRRYNNIYCYVFQIKDGRIILLREYQNTLLVFDVMSAP
jgi:ketosteroid isomerase-like protein